MARQAVVEVQQGEPVVGEYVRLGCHVLGVVERAREDVRFALPQAGEAEGAAAAGTETALDLSRGLVNRGGAFDPLQVLGPEPDAGQESRPRDPLTPAAVTVPSPPIPLTFDPDSS